MKERGREEEEAYFPDPIEIERHLLFWTFSLVESGDNVSLKRVAGVSPHTCVFVSDFDTSPCFGESGTLGQTISMWDRGFC